MTDDTDRILSDIAAITGKSRLLSLLRRVDQACQQGLFGEALDLSRQALQLDPDCADAHYQQGYILMALQRFEEAAAAYGRVIELNPQHPDAGYFLATIGRHTIPEQAPSSYVANLFDQYSDHFDQELLGRLHYRAPAIMFEAVRSLSDTPDGKLDILDLGCGTGLCGKPFAAWANSLTGVDLSYRMLEKARERNIYHRLIKADAGESLRLFSASLDLVLAGDVFVYIGKLDTLFAQVASALRRGGLMVFSIETGAGGADYTLHTSCRYAHSPGYIHRLAGTHGFRVAREVPFVLRQERGQALDGTVFVLILDST